MRPAFLLHADGAVTMTGAALVYSEGRPIPEQMLPLIAIRNSPGEEKGSENSCCVGDTAAAVEHHYGLRKLGSFGSTRW